MNVGTTGSRRAEFVAANFVPRSVVLLTGILIAGLALRAALMPLPGRAGDIATFVGWLAIVERYGTHGLYDHIEPISGFAVNYPPVYALILTGTARLYGALPLALHDHGGLVALLKAPAVVADVAMAALTYAIVLRWRSRKDALIAAAIVAFGPWTWLISAVWGQADTVVALFLLVALAFALAERFAFAWVALAIAVLVKFFPIVVIPVLLVWQIRRQGLSARVAVGPVLGLTVAYVTSLPFAPTANPIGVFTWLLALVRAGYSHFPYESVSAFNVYTLTGSFFIPDAGSVFGLSPGNWGMVAFAALTASITVLFAQRCTTQSPSEREQALATAWFLILAGYFMLLTRMHERYLLPALALAPLVWFARGVPRVGVAALLCTFSMSLIFGLIGTFGHDFHGVGLLIAASSALNVGAFAFLLFCFARKPKQSLRA